MKIYIKSTGSPYNFYYALDGVKLVKTRSGYTAIDFYDKYEISKSTFYRQPENLRFSFPENFAFKSLFAHKREPLEIGFFGILSKLEEFFNE